MRIRLCLAATLLLLGACALSARAETPPNLVVFFLDDSGWADFHPFGDPPYPTPNMERMAREGTRFTQFYVPQAVCSASRASLLTGCYPGRTKITGALSPDARGLERDIPTLAEILKPRGYATGLFGKWHLGDQPDTRPRARGFDETCGIMYSNDMWAGHPENPKLWGKKPLQYYENDDVVIASVTAEDQKTFTQRFTRAAVSFIERHKAEPFFLYVPHPQPHVPLFCSPEFEGKSGAGLYGDVIMELDWSLGQILDALDAAGVTDNTLVLFTSDNGPWHVYGNHAGKTPYREAKGTSFDGGTRSACIARWPGKIPADTVSEAVWSTLDLAPTFATLAGASLSGDDVDGKDVWPLVSGAPGATNPHEAYFLSTGPKLEAVVSGDGRWKLHLPHKYRVVEHYGSDGKSGKYTQEDLGLSLYDLDADPVESRNVLDAHPEIAARFKELAEEHRATYYKRPE